MILFFVIIPSISKRHLALHKDDKDVLEIDLIDDSDEIPYPP